MHSVIQALRDMRPVQLLDFDTVSISLSVYSLMNSFDVLLTDFNALFIRIQMEDILE